jgi:hypothetical protein
MKGILVLHDNDELKKVKSQVALSPELQNIIKVTDTEAFVVGNVKYDSDGDPLLFSVDNNFLIKL